MDWSINLTTLLLCCDANFFSTGRMGCCFDNLWMYIVFQWLFYPVTLGVNSLMTTVYTAISDGLSKWFIGLGTGMGSDGLIINLATLLLCCDANFAVTGRRGDYHFDDLRMYTVFQQPNGIKRLLYPVTLGADLLMTTVHSVINDGLSRWFIGLIHVGDPDGLIN